jgi:hypothetical protein
MTAEQPRFLIIVPTYNRNEMLNDTLRSIFDQTYDAWHVLVSDNASPQPAEGTVPREYQSDPRFTLVRRDELVPGTSHWEGLFRRSLELDYDHLLLLADDDLLLPFALEQVALHAGDYPVVQTSFYGYYADDGTLGMGDMLADPAQDLIEFDPQAMFRYFVESCGVSIKGETGRRHPRPAIGPTHVSTQFLHRALLERTLSRYKRLLVTPFGDAGFLKFVTDAGPWLYINCPLAIIRFHGASYGNAAGAAGSAPRSRLAQQHDMALDHSVLKARTFSNGARESCLAALDDMGIAVEPRIGPNFMLRHTREILRDRPWTAATYRDLLEVLPYLMRDLPTIARYLAGYVLRHERLPYHTTYTRDLASIWDAMMICVEDHGATYLAWHRQMVREGKASP